MTTGGWFVMLASVGTVTVLMLWCLYKVLATPHETEHIHGFEGHPHDIDEDEA